MKSVWKWGIERNVKGKRRRQLSTSEIVYGIIIIALILYVLYDTAVHGRGGNDISLD